MVLSIAVSAVAAPSMGHPATAHADQLPRRDGVNLVRHEDRPSIVATGPRSASSPAADRVPDLDSELNRGDRPATSRRFPAFHGVGDAEGRTATSWLTDGQETRKVDDGTGPLMTVVSSLVLVLGLFAGFVWLMRSMAAKTKSGGQLPKDVVRVLGTTSLDHRTQLRLVRCGNKILIVSQTPTSMASLGEITDVDDVVSLTAACTGESTKRFAETIRDLERQPASKGFAGTASETPREADTPRRRLFASA